MRIASCFVAFCLLFAGCASSIKVNSFTDQEYPPGDVVDVFHKTPQRGGYTEIGELTLRTNSITEDLITKLQKKAQEYGADAIVIAKKRHGQVSSVGEKDKTSGGTHPMVYRVTATMIVYDDI